MKKKIISTLMAAVVATTIAGAASITSFAAETDASTDVSTETTVQNLDATVVAQVFDAEYYAATYPDVVEAFGNDSSMLLAHYMANGIYEDRDASETFNATIYAAANEDLQTVYGDNLESYIEHYILCGKDENRIASNSDLAELGLTYAPSYASGSSSSSSSSSDSTDTSTVSAAGTITNVYGNQVSFGESFDLSTAVGADSGTVTGQYVGTQNNYHLEVGIQEGSDTSWSHVESTVDESLFD